MNATAPAAALARSAAPAVHIASLDSVRGLAVLLVMICHFGWSFPIATTLTAGLHDFFWSGWIGVDMFFALSGFLITRGLVAESSRGVGERLRLFWTRRFLRIFPLYYATLIIGAIADHFAHRPPPSLAYWLYFQNYTIAVAPMHQVDWTNHFWSLAVEEQFYLFWPLVMLLAPARRRIPFTIALFALGAAGRTFLHFCGVAYLGIDPEHLPKILYCATPTHMDGLLLGALVSMLVQEPDHLLARLWRRFRMPVAAGSILGIFGLVMLTARNGLGVAHTLSQFDGRVAVLGYPLLAIAFATLVYGLVDRPASAKTPWPWTSRVLTSCGRVSYGMYVFHWPLAWAVIVPMEQAHLSNGAAAAVCLGYMVFGCALTWGFAQLSYTYFEAPFLKLKKHFSG
jgi:peptidoglycan/LPS O-acetylase OafA/YrhL